MSTKCITPFYVKQGLTTNEKIPVPCGKCPPCMKRRTSGWSFRLVKEGDVSNSALFVTLTYDTKYVPITKKGYLTLCKDDVQRFFKRLRKLTKEKIKYFIVGEYGTQKMRPHYHIILFNANREMIARAWAKDGRELGSIFIGDVSEASIGYTLKYMQKPGKIPIHQNDDRQKEFQLMSKGLGKSYLTQKMIKWHKEDLEQRMYIPMKDGKKIAMPRYYKDKMYSESEKNRIARRMERVGEELDSELHKKYGENVFSELAKIHIDNFRKMYKKSKEGTTL
jgi:hypothetical protein